MPSPSKKSPIWPREHGATMELLFPLLTVWMLGRATAASYALGLAAVCVFVAHEPLLVVAGRRGTRRRADELPGAIRRLLSLGAVAVTLGGIGLALADTTTRLLALVPVAAGVVAFAVAVRGRERTLAGELYAALVLTSVALPVATAAGLSLQRTAVMLTMWLVGFALATTAARGVVVRSRDGGRGLRLAWLGAAVVLGGGVALFASGRVGAATAFGPAPFALAAIGLALRPPGPKAMTAVGIALTSAGAVTLALLWASPI
jgi:hypothetical protein